MSHATTPLEAGAVPTGSRLPVASLRAQWLQQMAKGSVSKSSFDQDSFRHLDAILNDMTPFELQQFFVRQGSGHQGSSHQGTFTRPRSSSCSDLSGFGHSSLTLDEVLARIRGDQEEEASAAPTKRVKELRALPRTTKGKNVEQAPKAEPLRREPLPERVVKKILRGIGFRL
jgi:hypothetical protein